MGVLGAVCVGVCVCVCVVRFCMLSLCVSAMDRGRGERESAILYCTVFCNSEDFPLV